MVDQTPSAGWHPDPVGRHGQRYWDGNEWTSYVADNGRTAVDPLVATSSKGEQAIAVREAYQAFPDLAGTHAECPGSSTNSTSRYVFESLLDGWRRREGDRWSLDLVQRDGDILANDRRRWTRHITVGEHVFEELQRGAVSRSVPAGAKSSISKQAHRSFGSKVAIPFTERR